METVPHADTIGFHSCNLQQRQPIKDSKEKVKLSPYRKILMEETLHKRSNLVVDRSVKEEIEKIDGDNPSIKEEIDKFDGDNLSKMEKKLRGCEAP